MSNASDWPTVKLGEVVEINPRLQTRPADDDNITFIPMTAVEEAGFISSKELRTYGEVKKGYTPFQKDDLLLAKITPCFQNKKISAADIDTEVGIGSTEFHVLRTSNAIDMKYLLHLLRQDSVVSEGEKCMTGSGGQRRVPRWFLENLSIPLPPLAEQQRIAGVLNQTTSILELARQEVREIDESRSALFESLFPASNYPVSTIGNFFSETQYGSSKKSGEAGKYPMLRMGNLSSTGSISYSDLKYLDLEEKEINKYTLRNRDILFNRTNSKELVGKTAVYYGEGDQVAYAGYLIRCRTNDLATPEFISGFLNSRIGKAQLFQRAKAIVGMANINAKELRTLRIPSVPVAEQEKYTSASRQLEDLRLAVEKKIEKLEELQKSLSTRAFAGQL